MEGLNELCKCCKNQHCLKDNVIIIDNGECITIKCLQFEKDESKIEPPDRFLYVVRSDVL